MACTPVPVSGAAISTSEEEGASQLDSWQCGSNDIVNVWGKGVIRVSIELCFGVPSELEAQGTPVCSPISWGLIIIKHALVMLVLAQPQPLSTPGYFSLMGSQLHTCCLRTPM
jgi:hypothetical protein